MSRLLEIPSAKVIAMVLRQPVLIACRPETILENLIRLATLLRTTGSDPLQMARHHHRVFRGSETSKSRCSCCLYGGGNARKLPDDFVFTGLKAPNLFRPLTRRQYVQQVKKWARLARIRDAHRYATHSLRRTRAAYIYEQTRNIEAVRQLLGHASLGSTSAYLNIDKKRALDIGRRYEL